VVSVSQGDVWWVDLGEPRGSGPGYRRPVIVVQGDAFNRSALQTVVVVPLTSNLRWAAAPGNLEIRPRDSGLPQSSVANVSQIIAIDRDALVERAGRLPRAKLDNAAAAERSAKGLKFVVAYTPITPGKRALTGELDFSVCTPKACITEQLCVAWETTVP